MNDDEEELRLLEALRKVRLRKAEKDAYKNIEYLRNSEIKQISMKIVELEEQILRSTIQRVEYLTRIEKIKRGEEDNLLTKNILKTLTLHETSPKDSSKHTRKVIIRPPLQGLIKNPTSFRYYHKGRYHRCQTNDGSSFITPSGQSYKSLASWTVAVIAECGGGGRKVSAYEVCEVWLNKCAKFVKWGDVYTSDCVSINE
jgi:hypothetical protein